MKPTNKRLFHISVLESWGDDNLTKEIIVLEPPFGVFRNASSDRVLTIDAIAQQEQIDIPFETKEAMQEALDSIKALISEDANWELQPDNSPFTIDVIYEDRELYRKRDEEKERLHKLWNECDCKAEAGCRKCLKSTKWYNQILNNLLFGIDLLSGPKGGTGPK